MKNNKKYINIAVQIKFIGILLHIVFIGSIVIRIITHDGSDYVGLVSMSICMIISLIAFDSVLITLKNLWYTTYINDDYIFQKFFCKTKQIHYDDIKLIIFVGELIILTKNESKNNLDKLDYSIRIRKKLLKLYKNDVIVGINVNDDSILQTLSTKSNAEIIVVSNNKTIIYQVNKYFKTK